MPYGTMQKTISVEWAECPNCAKKGRKKRAEGVNEIERLFGYRTMENGNVIPQSYCRTCRSKGFSNS